MLLAFVPAFQLPEFHSKLLKSIKGVMDLAPLCSGRWGVKWVHVLLSPPTTASKSQGDNWCSFVPLVCIAEDSRNFDCHISFSFDDLFAYHYSFALPLLSLPLSPSRWWSRAQGTKGLISSPKGTLLDCRIVWGYETVWNPGFSATLLYVW